MTSDLPPESLQSEDEFVAERERLPVEDGPSSDDRLWAMLAHLLTLTGYLVPLGNIIAPLIIWVVKKDQSPYVDYHGKESLNFQISILIYLLVSIPIAIFTCGVGIVLTIAIAIFDLVMVIIAGIKANGGERYRYPLTLRLIQ
jgi:uncharacterized Tic20 family protein